MRVIIDGRVNGIICNISVTGMYPEYQVVTFKRSPEFFFDVPVDLGETTLLDYRCPGGVGDKLTLSLKKSNKPLLLQMICM